MQIHKYSQPIWMYSYVSIAAKLGIHGIGTPNMFLKTLMNNLVDVAL